MFFVFWMFAGGIWFIEFLDGDTFSPSLLVLFGGETALLLAYGPARRSSPGALVGISLLLFLEALRLRHGPGQVCSELWNGHENCRYEPSPAPWAFGGILLFVGGIALQRYLQRRALQRRALQRRAREKQEQETPPP